MWNLEELYAWMDLSEVHKWDFYMTMMSRLCLWKDACNCVLYTNCIKLINGHVWVTCLHVCIKGGTVLKFGTWCGRSATRMSLTLG